MPDEDRNGGVRREGGLARVALVVAGVLALALAVRPASATVLHVDAARGSDANNGLTWATALATVTEALVEAARVVDADTIHVARGTYAANLLVDRSDITLLGGFPSGGGVRDTTLHPTVLDGGALGPTVRVSGNDGLVVLSGVVIDGFTIRNGRSYVRDDIAGGAGVFVEEAAVALTNNVITGNLASVPGSRGGGVYVYRWQAGPALLEGNVIDSNIVSDGLGGGAWLVDFADPATSAPHVFRGNDVRANRATARTDIDPADPDEPNGNGGGLYAWEGATLIEGNTFSGNVAEALTDFPYNGQGGGVFLEGGTPIVTSNVIESNEAIASGGSYGAAGGGAYFFSAGGLIADNTVRGNRVTGGDGKSQAWGAGLNVTLLGDESSVLTNNLIEDNATAGGSREAGRGGGLYLFVRAAGTATARVSGGALRNNSALMGGGGAWFGTSDSTAIVVDDLDVIGNAADRGGGVVASGLATLSNLRVRGNQTFDVDGDAVSELRDNCAGLANGVQADADFDGAGDACDPDDDGDGRTDAFDNCRLVSNPSQADANSDGQGDACQGDADGDGHADAGDNCPLVANPTQSDASSDGVGDACEPARFDAIGTSASGISLEGDVRLTNAEVVDNLGHGVAVLGEPADLVNGTPIQYATSFITNVTMSGNAGAGFVTYLTSTTQWTDSISADNLGLDGFDRLDGAGLPSSRSMICNGVYFGDGVGSMPCTGAGNIDATAGPIDFVTGALGDFYLAQIAAGDMSQSPAVDAGRVTAASSPVNGLTTRTDAVPDAGVVDLGFHYPLVASPPSGDLLRDDVRVTRDATAVLISLDSVPARVVTVRLFRGPLDALPTEYAHVTPFSGQPGDPECAYPATDPFRDVLALTDGNDWYYLVVVLDSGVEGHFGSDSFGVPRPRPEDSPTDAVTSACP